MAVYTHVAATTLSQFLDANYALGRLETASGIESGVENSNYLLELRDAVGEHHNYILTLYEKRVKEADLPFFLGLMQHLVEHNLPCPRPIARRDGALIGTLEGRPCALVSFLPGESVAQPNVSHCAQVGALLGLMHRAAQDFPLVRPNDLSLAGWKKLFAKTKDRLDEIEPGLQKLVGDELVYLEKHMPQGAALPRGVIHADLFPDNVFFAEGKLSGVIDFYFASEDFLSYDLAVTLNAWCFANNQWDAQKADALLAHYRREHALSAAETKALPLLLRGAALRFLLTRAHDLLNHPSGALVKPHDPRDYIARLKFHRSSHDA